MIYPIILFSLLLKIYINEASRQLGELSCKIGGYETKMKLISVVEVSSGYILALFNIRSIHV